VADVSVRPASPDDAAAVAAVQARAWREGYVEVLPLAVLAGLDPAAMAPGWQEAAASPPSPRHRLLVAVEGGQVTGFAASAPAEDDDLDAGEVTEVLALHVDPAAGRRGHGSRLLAATVDLAREDGVGAAVSWVLAGDRVTRHFLQAAGWAPDGATRDLDMGALVPQLRLHTDLRAE
jgi:GNAT superfamily N-acetyltransferase